MNTLGGSEGISLVVQFTVRSRPHHFAFLYFCLFQSGMPLPCSMLACACVHASCTPPPSWLPLQGNKTELEALLAADGLFSGTAKVGFTLLPTEVKYKEMPWIDTVVFNAGGCSLVLLSHQQWFVVASGRWWD